MSKKNASIELGATTTEYGLMVGILALGIVTSTSMLSNKAKSSFNTAGDAMSRTTYGHVAGSIQPRAIAGTSWSCLVNPTISGGLVQPGTYRIVYGWNNTLSSPQSLPLGGAGGGNFNQILGINGQPVATPNTTFAPGIGLTSITAAYNPTNGEQPYPYWMIDENSIQSSFVACPLAIVNAVNGGAPAFAEMAAADVSAGSTLHSQLAENGWV